MGFFGNTEDGTTAVLFTMEREGEGAEEYNNTVAPGNTAELVDEVRDENIDQLLVMDGTDGGFSQVEDVLHGVEDAQYLNQNSGFVESHYMFDQVPPGKGSALHCAVPFIENEDVVLLDSDLNVSWKEEFDESISTVAQKLSEPLKNGKKFVKADLRRSQEYDFGAEETRNMAGGRVTRAVKALGEATEERGDFVTDFNYPLSGEVGIKKNELEKLRIPKMYGLEIGTLVQMRSMPDFRIEEVQIDHSHLSHGDEGAIEIAENVFDALNQSYEEIYEENLYQSVNGENREEKLEALQEAMNGIWMEEKNSDSGLDPGVYWAEEKILGLAYQAEQNKVSEEFLPAWREERLDTNGSYERSAQGYSG